MTDAQGCTGGGSLSDEVERVHMKEFPHKFNSDCNGSRRVEFLRLGGLKRLLEFFLC